MRLIKRYAEFQPRAQLTNVPHHTRGIYFLLNHRPKIKKYDVVYVGISAKPNSGIGGRLRKHLKSTHKEWTHFSIYEASDQLDEQQIRELEGFILTTYRKDSRVNQFNIQTRSAFLKKVRVNNLKSWPKNK